MVRERSRTQPPPLRCPFCHEGVELDREEWVVCAGCLGRHHRSCWSESAGCAACEETRALRPAEAPPEGEASERAPGGELLELLDAHERRSENSPLSYLLSPLTLGLQPLLAAERELAAHAERNRADLPSEARPGTEGRVERYRLEALEGTARGARRRSRVAWVCFLPSLLVVAAGLATILFNLTGSSRVSGQLGLLQVLVGAVPWLVAQVTLLAFHWAAVRRHEARQLYLGLLQRGAGEEEAEGRLAEHERAWTRSGRLAALGVGLSCLPPLVFLLPFVLVRAWRAPLALHERRERGVPDLSPRRAPAKGGEELAEA
ncbi:MAG: hypothetical protein D6731_22645 [Planctomycetota bacterium]|nr:MAG: hypothetical protein D6731_22645 [Planctomycetota bacterium]